MNGGNNSKKVYQTVWLNKKSYKPIILGKEGKSIKMISIQARQDMEKFLKESPSFYKTENKEIRVMFACV